MDAPWTAWRRRRVGNGGSQRRVHGTAIPVVVVVDAQTNRKCGPTVPREPGADGADRRRDQMAPIAQRRTGAKSPRSLVRVSCTQSDCTAIAWRDILSIMDFVGTMKKLVSLRDVKAVESWDRSVYTGSRIVESTYSYIADKGTV